MLLIWLLFAHHLADVALQPSWLIRSKHEHWWSIYEHVWIWTGVVSLTLAWFGLFAVWKFVFLFVGHFGIDYIKYNHTDCWEAIYPDQLLHYVQLIAVCYL